jgi:hypothetical protein
VKVYSLSARQAVNLRSRLALMSGAHPLFHLRPTQDTTMNKILALVIAAAFSTGVFAQAATPATPAAPAAQATPGSKAEAPKKATKAKKAKKAKKAEKAA